MYGLIKKVLVVGVFSLALIGVGAAVPTVAHAAPVDVLSACNGNAEGTVCQGGSGGVFAVLKNIVNLLITIGGVISIIMIVVGGIRFSTSGGDPKGITAGRDTIIYSVIGLVVSIMAFSIVNFVLGRL